ncbi:MAG: ATP-dependent helicase [Lachnospiraceae bacterium]|nr:ATP-dependent helicase [Lachnospiraceae bacterium]
MIQQNTTAALPRSNSAQEEAIRHRDGPMLVLAGPGSGKTYVITNRVKHLIEESLVPPEEILVITFSRAAADEMKQRFDALTGGLYPGVTFGTFHACFFHMLQYARGYSADSILREAEAVSVLGEILTDIRPEYAEDPALVRDIYEEILRVKCSVLDTTHVEHLKYKSSTCDGKTFFEAFTRYLEALRVRRKLDFEDMLLLTRELLTEDDSVLSFWRKRYRYLLVDEFQDVNRLQYEIVRLLAGEDGNLFAVGDDDQSIYGFRGSDPQIMQQMPMDMPSCRIVTLPVNYRSTPQIVSAADALIANNSVRYQKEHTTAQPDGSAVRMLRFETVSSENEFLLSEISSLAAAGCPLREIAVLFRTNLQMRSLCDALGRSGIPYRIRGFLPNLYDDPHVQVVLAYLRAAGGDRSRRTVLTIANQPKRYLERRLLTDPKIDLAAIREQVRREGKAYLANNVDRLIYDLAMLSKMNPFAAVNYIRKVIGYDKHVVEHSPRSEDSLDTLAEFQETVRAYETVPQLLEAIEEASRGDSVRRGAQTNRQDDTQDDRVALMTFHASKGLEFRHVYICDCNETLVPHKKALLPETIEEERRLLYVAMTRARESLSLLYTDKRFGKELPPSGFLGEILLPASALTPGTRVSHRQFGEGTVLSLSDDRLRIRFDRFLLPKTLSYRLCARSMLIQLLL